MREHCGFPEDEHSFLLGCIGASDSGLCLSPPRPQNCMNLPPDKVQLLSQYDNEKKWELICDQVGAWKAQLPLLLLLGNPVLRMQELAGEGPAYCPGANMYQGGWGPMQDSLFP